MIFKSARRATSLLHWRVDPEIFPLVAVLSGGAAIGAYTLYNSRASFLQSLVPQENSHLDFKERSVKEHKVRLHPDMMHRIGTSLNMKKD
ncbi:hypothetical protein K502DRAFT_324430, partial [Neoconidiobolus thromboides FSU 785]